MFDLKLKKGKASAEPGKPSARASNPQGITARGNALYQITGVALLVLLGLILLGFAYLAMLREPNLQRTQIDRVASSYAVQQATSVHRLISNLRTRMEGAARSPLAVSAIASQSDADIGLVEQAMLDYFPEDFLTIIDESHATVPQIGGMYHGDRSRKVTLVEHGFRLPSALDNRPLTFDEWEAMAPQTIYVSATPADYEMEKSEGVFVDQVIRPTGLLDPPIDVRPSRNQVDDLMEEIRRRSAAGERVLVTTMTKRMAEELNTYLGRFDIRCRYIHSDVDTLERVEILEGLRSGEFDVLVGVNLLREGLDLPEVSLVAILDADKEGFLRSGRALTQTAGRAARNLNGLVVMYADRITGSMQATIDETNRRRAKQLKYNEEMGITPRQIVKKGGAMIAGLRRKGVTVKAYAGPERADVAADPVVRYMSKEQLEKAMDKTRRQMEKAAAALDFVEAARLRDEIEGMRRLAGGGER